MEALRPDQRRLLQKGLSPEPRGTARAERFSRQARFKPLGTAGQERLQRARVAIVGIGALGTHLADAIVRAGAAQVWLIDRDVVEPHNLPRQVLFDEADAARGTPKAVAAAEHLRRIDGACDLVAVADEFTPTTLADLGAEPDLILDGTDNFATRYVINDVALQRGVPWVYGAALGSEGMAMAVLPGRTPCLRCILPEPPASGDGGTCETEGILAPAVAMVTAFQSAQAIKILAGRLDEVARGVFTVDVWRDRYGMQLEHAERSPDCASCAAGELPALRAGAAPAVTLCGREAVQVRPTGTGFDRTAWVARLRGAGVEVEETPHLVRFAADGCRFSVFADGRALLFGTADTRRASALYDRWVGGR